jgi:hypothetical protein
LTVTNTNWITAATPEDAVRQAVSGSVTLNTSYDEGHSTLMFPRDLGSDFGFAVLGAANEDASSQLTWDAANSRYTGAIGMWDGDSGAPQDWDFYWNVAVTQAQFSSLAISDSADQTNLTNLNPAPQTNDDFFIADTSNGEPILKLHAGLSPSDPNLRGRRRPRDRLGWSAGSR